MSEYVDELINKLNKFESENYEKIPSHFRSISFESSDGLKISYGAEGSVFVNLLEELSDKFKKRPMIKNKKKL